MKIALVVLLVSVTLSGMALAVEPPLGFSDIPWGTPKEDVRKSLAGRCKMPAEKQPDKISCVGYSLEGLAIVTTVELEFLDGGLQGYSFQVPIKKSFDLLLALQAKFGPAFSNPKKDDSMPVVHWQWLTVGASYVTYSPVLFPGRLPHLDVSTTKLTNAKIQGLKDRGDSLKKGF